MAYNPEQHHRRSLRLPNHDYTSVGGYFITICTHQRQCLFGNDIISNPSMMPLSVFGKIAQTCWQAIPQHFSNAVLDEFVVMPNHVHGIVFITSNGNRDIAMPCLYSSTSQNKKRQFGKPVSRSLSRIVGSFKSAVTKQVNQVRNTPNTPIWQRNYYEHVIRNDAALYRIRQYIRDNPLSWQQDQLHPERSSKW